MTLKLPGPQAFLPVVMAAVVVVITPFFVAIIAMRQVIGMSSPVGSLSGSLDGSGSGGSFSGSLGCFGVSLSGSMQSDEYEET